MRLWYVLPVVLLSCSSPLSVTISGDGAGEVKGAMSSCRSSCELRGPLTAVADEHSRFAGWSGSCSGVDECRATSGAVTATFTASEYPVQVSQVGEGTLTSGGQAIAAGTLWVPRDTTVMLVATPATGWAFARWEATCDSQPTPGSCEVRATAAQDARAVFDRTYEVTVVIEGAGEVAAVLPIGRCTSRCSGRMPVGSTLAMTATAEMAHTFAEWVNGCGTQANCDLTITQDVTVTARFQPNIEVTASGDGSGTIMGVAGCTAAPCSLSWGPGRRYQLQAVANENSRFVGYVGCPDVRGAFCLVNQYTPSIRLVFEQIVVDPMLGDTEFPRDGRLVSTPEAEFVWLYGSGQMTLGGVREDGGVLLGVDRWVLFQTRPGPTRDLLRPGNEGELISAQPQVDGGMVFVMRAMNLISVGGQPLNLFDEAIVSMAPSGAYEWVSVNPGPTSDIHELRTNPATGQTYLLGGLRSLAGPVTYGATTITPIPDAGLTDTRLYVAALDRHGQRQWAAQRYDTAETGGWPLFALSSGPAVFGVVRNSVGNPPCVPVWSPTMTEPAANLWSFYTTQGGCLRSGATPQQPLAATGAIPFAGFSAVSDGPGPGISMVGFATGTTRWSQTTIPSGLFYAYQEGAAEPTVHSFAACASTVFTFVEAVSPTRVVLGGNGQCIPDVDTMPRAYGALVVLYDRQAGSVVRGWHLPNSTLHSIAKLNDREVRVLLSFTPPMRIGGVDYPMSMNRPRRYLLLTLRP